MKVVICPNAKSCQGRITCTHAIAHTHIDHCDDGCETDDESEEFVGPCEETTEEKYIWEHGLKLVEDEDK